MARFFPHTVDLWLVAGRHHDQRIEEIFFLYELCGYPRFVASVFTNPPCVLLEDKNRCDVNGKWILTDDSYSFTDPKIAALFKLRFA